MQKLRYTSCLEGKKVWLTNEHVEVEKAATLPLPGLAYWKTEINAILTLIIQTIFLLDELK